jgi:rhamnulokinase
VSCGTWSLLGVELDEPLTGADAFAAQYTNEGGYGGSIRFLKNIMGQWMANELKRDYERAHGPISFAELDAQELAAPKFTAFVDVDAPQFGLAGHMTEKIHAFCDRTGQKRPEGLGHLMRVINESIALSFRANIDALEKILGYGLPNLRIVGGGIKNRSLMRMAAGALDRPVHAGPIEASAAGNILAQLLAAGEIKDKWEARQLVAASFDERVYEPDANDAAGWREAAARYKEKVRGN